MNVLEDIGFRVVVVQGVYLKKITSKKELCL